MADGLFGGGGAAFGVYPQMGGRRRMQDPQGSADVPLQALIGRLAGLLGAPAEVGNIVRSPQPMEMFGDVNYDPQTQLPYDTKYFNQRLPLQPTSRAGELAREAGSFVPLNPMPAVRAGQGIARMAGQEITDVMSGLPARSALGAITPQPMFAVSPSIAREGNPIQSAVVLVGDKIFTGRTHGDALNRAVYEGAVRKEGGKYIYPKGAEVNSDLFMTNTGQIIDRLQASKMFDIGASETAIEKGLMQNKPPSSMTVEQYTDQAKAIKNQREQLINLDKGIYKPELTMDEMLKVKDIPTVDRVRQSIDLVGEDQFKKMVDAQYKKYKPTDQDQEAMLVESVTLDILGKAQRSPAEYPLAPAGTRYEEFGGKLTYMTPDEFLQKVRPLELDAESLDNIAALRSHVESGGKLDPLHIYSTGKEDGRHRAYLAKELGIEKVPVALHGQPTNLIETSPMYTDPFGNTIGESIR